MVNQRGACQAFEKEPRQYVEGTSQVSAINEEIQEDPLFLADEIILHAMGKYSNTPYWSASARSIPRRYGAFAESRIAVFRPPKQTQMDSGGK